MFWVYTVGRVLNAYGSECRMPMNAQQKGLLTYDQILNYLKKTKKEERIERYKKLLEFNNVPFEADLFTWNNDALN